jgi:hypothetical protein
LVDETKRKTVRKEELTSSVALFPSTRQHFHKAAFSKIAALTFPEQPAGEEYEVPGVLDVFVRLTLA